MGLENSQPDAPQIAVLVFAVVVAIYTIWYCVSKNYVADKAQGLPIQKNKEQEEDPDDLEKQPLIQQANAPAALLPAVEQAQEQKHDVDHFVDDQSPIFYNGKFQEQPAPFPVADQVEEQKHDADQVVDYLPADFYNGKFQEYIAKARDLQQQGKFDDGEMIAAAKNAAEIQRESYLAHALLGEALVEDGKMENQRGQLEKTQDNVSLGVENLQCAVKLCKEQNIQGDVYDALVTKLRRARKIEYLKNLQSDVTKDEARAAEINTKTKTLKYLQIVYKKSKDEQASNKQLYEEMRTVIGAKKRMTQKDLVVPSYLTCYVTQVLLIDPVMLTSGITYDNKFISQHFKQKKNQAQREKVELDVEEYDYDSYFKCPKTQIEVDPNVLLTDRRIKQAVLDFLDKNPWAYEFNHNKDDWRNITVTPLVLQPAK